ncbi:MAG TPA: DNA polymerase IV [Coriobacteriia bacterium]|jgi:DNA polymerase-4
MGESSDRWSGRAILHVDMDAFFASVEQLDHPEWRGKAVIVGHPGERGVVSAASYEARVFGVHSAMPSARAKRLAPEAVWTPPRFERYGEFSRRVRAIFGSVTPYVQTASIDEAYLDVTPASDSSPDPVELARRIQAEVDALGLSCSIGVAASKTVAKIASDHDKPHGLTVVHPGEEPAFLGPLPVRALPGVGPATAQRLQHLGIRTLGELAALDAVTAVQVFGDYGHTLVLRAAGVDTSDVREERERKSLSKEHTFARDISSREEVEAALRRLAEQVGERLRAKALAGRTVSVKLRFGDFTTKTLRRTLPVATDLESVFLPVAMELLRHSWSPGIGLRLLGLGVSGFDEPAEQLDLFGSEKATETLRRRALAEGVDAVRRRFGDGALRMGPGRSGEKEEPDAPAR